jgi:hypothetical protein
MRTQLSSLLGLLTLGGALLVSGCTQNPATPPNTAKPQTAQKQTTTSPAPRRQGGQASAGAIQNVRQAAKRVGDENDLHNFALAYTQYALLNGQGPSHVQEIRDSLTPKIAKAFQDDGDYEVNWGLKNPSGNSILAYAKDPDLYGTRLVAKGDGSVVRMSKEQFEQAQSGR